jgi:hypothetical protein
MFALHNHAPFVAFYSPGILLLGLNFGTLCSAMASSAKHVSRDMKPEAGLAEWTSKIKAMQQQVDADEEAEQRRLAEEIAASRLARLRRSRVGQTSRPNSMDLCKFASSITSPVGE